MYLDHIQLSVHEYRDKLYEIIAARKINIRRIQYEKLSSRTATRTSNNNDEEEKCEGIQRQPNDKEGKYEGIQRQPNGKMCHEKRELTDVWKENNAISSDNSGNKSIVSPPTTKLHSKRVASTSQQPRPNTSQPDCKHQQQQEQSNSQIKKQQQKPRPETGYHQTAPTTNGTIHQHRKSFQYDTRNNGHGLRYRQEFGSTTSVERKEGVVGR